METPIHILILFGYFRGSFAGLPSPLLGRRQYSYGSPGPRLPPFQGPPPPLRPPPRSALPTALGAGRPPPDPDPGMHLPFRRNRVSFPRSSPVGRRPHLPTTTMDASAMEWRSERGCCMFPSGHLRLFGWFG